MIADFNGKDTASGKSVAIVLNNQDLEWLIRFLKS
jgi:hypothetical protein